MSLCLRRLVPGLSVLFTLFSSAAAQEAGFFDVDEKAILYSTEYYWPRGDFEEEHRKIDIALLSAHAVWQFAGGFELQLGGGLLVGQGTKSQIDDPVERDSDGYGIHAGGTLRYYLLRTGPVSAFVDGILNTAWTPGQQFPDGGSGSNGWVQWGLGLRYDVSGDWAVEGGYRHSHMSNGGGLVPHNPAWNGQGMYLGVRQRYAF
jgi:opacity protein-like surface antigen